MLAGSVATVAVFDDSFDNAFLLKSALMHEMEKKWELRPYACYALLIIIMSVSLNSCIFFEVFCDTKTISSMTN